ncbi:MAG TPA: AAA domain-containing protein, partial [Gemmataceae bacterium]|nr:AAA domain-containing protein [Gemmataceae bacterium]
RIVTLPGEPPALAEVVFPRSFSIEQAKGFIFKELDELAIQPTGRHGCWLEDADRFLFHMGQDTNGPATMVPLEAGVREGVHSRRTTCRLEFDKAAGWNRDSVASWLQKRLGLRDIGRAITLLNPYRMQPELAAILTDLLFGEHTDAASDRNGNGNGAPRPLIFVPVPSLRKRTVSTVLPKEGAGLELDLTATRGGDRLPADLRAALPGRGIVNYYEAQALVRHLEKLVQDPAVAKTAIPGRPAIGVVALYAGQVELIRLLCRRSPILSKSPVAIEIGLPADHCHREFPLVLCSLTRSHSFRAVSLGEDASALILALTRARTRLMVFGDPGTLVRRSHWQGRLDHLDEHAASREAQCVGHLVHYLKGQGTFAWAFHVDTDER